MLPEIVKLFGVLWFCDTQMMGLTDAGATPRPDWLARFSLNARFGEF